MSNETENTATPAVKVGFTTHLTFYHPNAKNTGSAIQFSIFPATPDREGRVVFTISRQKTVGRIESETMAERYATFDWANAATVKITFVEAAELLMVLGGQASVLTHAGKEGLFHNSPAATTSVALKRSEDPCRPGFILGVGRTPKADPNERTYHTFCFWPAEALGLRFALMAKMGDLAFGNASRD